MGRPFDPFTIPLIGTQLIEASAGTGKTYSIASLYLLLLLKKNLNVEQILVVTFTEAATAELHERIRSRIRDAADWLNGKSRKKDPFFAELFKDSGNHEAYGRKLQAALHGIDSAAITTIHGFCHRVLQQHALESCLPFDLELTGSTENLLNELVQDFIGANFYSLDSRIVGLVRRRITPSELLLLAREVCTHREYPVISPDFTMDDLARLWAQLEDAYADCRRAWLAEKEKVTDFLSSADKCLVKNGKELLASGLVEQLSSFFSQSVPDDVEPYKNFSFLVPGKFFTVNALKKGLVPGFEFFRAWDEFIACRDACAQGYQAFFLSRAAIFFRKELPARLLANQQQSFDDLLHGLAGALAERDGEILGAKIRSQYPAALIDEFQDTDPVQYRIFKSIYCKKSESLFLIGDPKQAIYGFRGADIYAYLQAALEAGDDRFTMLTNWRADRGLIAATNALFGATANPFFDSRIQFPLVNPRQDAVDAFRSESLGDSPLQFLVLPDDQVGSRGSRLLKKEVEPLIPHLVATDIARLLADGRTTLHGRPLQQADIAVLVRKNRQAEEIQQALRRQGIAAVLQSKASVFASSEAGEFARLLTALVDPADETAIRAVLLTPMFGMTVNDLHALMGRENEWAAIHEKFYRWQATLESHGIMQAMQTIWEEQDVAARIVMSANGERHLTNLRHLTELVQKAEVENHLNPAMLLDWYRGRIREQSAGEEAELRLESDENAVQLITLHRSKGLEYPVVYCPYLSFGPSERARHNFVSFHDRTENWRGKVVLLPGAEELDQAFRESFAEDLRLLYVGVTRARHACMIPWLPAAGYDTSALAFLLHGPQAESETLGDLKKWLAYLKDIPLAGLQEELSLRCAANPNWLFRTMEPDGGKPLAQAGENLPIQFDCRRMARQLTQHWRIGSFSHLTAKSHGPGLAEDFFPHATTEEAAQGGMMPAGEDPAAELLLARFPKGPAAGNFFHKLFELMDFSLIRAPEDLLVMVREQLDFYGYAEQWSGPVCRAIFEVLTTRLHGKIPFALNNILPDQRMNELPFTFPVETYPDGTMALTPGSLSRPFLDCPAGIPAGYAESLRLLEFLPLQGFLKGFVDLVFVHDGKWYIVDYKSNHLGDVRSDYGQAQMQASMMEHHYFLQYHIYAVALHRYLTQRLPDYQYQTHFGGVFYLYIKGMHPESGPAAGIFYDLPPLARIAALNRIFQAAGQEARS